MNLVYCTLLVCLLCGSKAAKNPGPSVFVVTPAPRSNTDNEARSAPFYYHNWMRRMDEPQNKTVTTTTTEKVKTPDLIFAEFESESEDAMRKSIRKLLEQERVAAKTSTTTTTTPRPIYVPEEDEHVNQPAIQESHKDDTSKNEVDMKDYFALYNNLYGDMQNSHIPHVSGPVYLPSTTTSTTTTTTTTPAPASVENIWHIIDSEKRNQFSGKWEEVPLNSNGAKDEGTTEDSKSQNNNENTSEEEQDFGQMPENFALPGFNTNPAKGAENESRAIRTEPNIRFPYVSLKPFLMKNMNKPHLNGFSSKKGNDNNMFSLDDFKEVKHPVRGEVQDTAVMREPIDRYNPAQPYLPQEYGSKSKQSSPSSPPSKSVANLVPPPPPPPKVTGDDFPAPTNYESFPPYPPSTLGSQPPQQMSPPVSVYKPPKAISPDSDLGPPLDDSSDNSPMDLGYRYRPPSPPAFVPTLPPPSKPFSGYSYSKPADSPPAMDMGGSGYNYNKPSVTLDSPPSMDNMDMNGYTYNKPPTEYDSPPMGAGASDDKPDFHQYHYDKPADHPAPSYDHHEPPAPFGHDHDYPELIFDKPHGGGVKGGNDMKGNDVPMMPPPPPPDMKPGMDSGPPMDDHGFPPDFPGDLKFHHDFDDHDFHHYHHHHPTTTTTTTTEMPRVNRFSYYYLGKKLYYLPLYFSVYFIVYVGALIIKAVLRHKIVYPNSWRPNGTTASFFSKRSVDSWDLSNENLHEVTGRVTRAIAEAAEKYMKEKTKTE